MRRNRVLVSFLLLLLLLALAACGGTPQEEPEATTAAEPTEAPQEEAVDTGGEAGTDTGDLEPVRIGLYGPMTGPIAFIGEGFDFGIKLAIEELGNEIAGHPIEYVVADNKCNPTDAVNAVRKLIEEDEVDAIIGGGCSSATVAALPIIAEGQVPAVSGTSTNPGIYNQMGVGGNGYAFRINPDDLIMAQGFAEYIVDRSSVERISLVAENTDFGRGAIAAYKPIFESLGVEIATEDYFDLGTADFRPALTSMRASESGAVLIVMTENDCAAFMRQYREVGVEADVYSRGACTSPLFLELTQDDPAVADGIVEFAFFNKLQDPDLAERFEARWDTPLTGHRMGGYYAMYHTLAPAIEKVVADGDEINRETIRAALETLNVDTPAGLISFDDHNQAYTNGVLSVNVLQDDGTVEVELLDFVELGPVDHSGY
ncbi:MAG TPA: ABC transporter substrate-binding protein [Candidatus Binatia bacterium]|jgi:branched-chain amino acid transport system substrate-binding protein|nr:ABC transporter substrate-binding protein [Candidatus Binatia bacterium]